MKKFILLSAICFSFFSQVEGGDFRWIKKSNTEGAYQKTWKCPYCHYTWPIGTPCRNPDCPSKYTDEGCSFEEKQTALEIKVIELENLVKRLLN